MRSLSKLVKCDEVAFLPSCRMLDGAAKKTDRLESIRARTVLQAAANAEAQMQARAMYEQIVAKARAEAQSIRAEAFEQGRREGYAAGMQAARGETEGALHAVQDLFARLDAERHTLFEENRADVLRLALTVAGRVVDRTLAEDDGAYAGLFARAARELHGQRRVRLTVSGHEAAFATENADYLLGMVRDAEHIEVIVDDEAPRGACLIETESLVIDAGAATQMEKYRKALYAV